MVGKKKFSDKATKEQVEKTLGETKKNVITQKIYVGPNLLGLPKYTVVKDGFTQHIKDLFEKCPEIENLFVSIVDMAMTEKRVKTSGTLEQRYYKKINEFKNGKDE